MSLASLGVRCVSSEVFLSVIKGTVDNPVIVDTKRLKQPVAFQFPQALCWYREQLMAICREFDISSCVVRSAEPMARLMGAAAKEGFLKRCNIEGVIIEGVASLGIKVSVGPMATISSLMGSKHAKSYKDKEDLRSIREWSTMNSNLKEAVLSGIAALALMGS